ncbi:MAG TPA: hypothetical protein VNZ22_20760, partial [Bacillota bacterium]|nr:hypothetical protein [Bacillota bacterium]
AGLHLTELSPAEGIRLMLDFYREVRFDGCPLEEDGDMLLFQWGPAGEGREQTFQCDISRQFIEAEVTEDDTISQLSLTFHFAPSPALRALKEGNRWCSLPDELAGFEAFITASKVYRAVETLQPTRVTLASGEV